MPIVQCQNPSCGKSFSIVPGYLKNGKGKFCSRTCRCPVPEQYSWDIEEIWKPIPGFEGYEASNTGKVKSYKIYPEGRIFGLRLDNYGYPVVSCNGVKRVHKLVALTFLGPRPEGMEVCHSDGNPLNNRLDNLRYDTHAANMREIRVKRERYTEIAEEIRILRRQGATLTELSEKYNIAKGNIYNIVSGRTYKSLPGPIRGIDY